MLGQLIPRGGGDPIPLLKPKLVVGRRDHCDIVLDFPNVSSRHCELSFADGYWCVRDLNSANHIKVNGERCLKKWLMPGDLLSVAKHQFEIAYEPTGSGPPPDEEEDIFSKSLLEKAGLQQNDRPVRMPRAVRPPKPESAKPNPDEDLAMKFLTGDE